MASSTWRLTTSRSGRNAYQATKAATTTIGIATFVHFFILVSPLRQASGAGNASNLVFSRPDSNVSLALDTFDLAAVHTDRRSGHPLRCRGDEKTQQVGNLLRFSKSADSHFLGELLNC